MCVCVYLYTLDIYLTAIDTQRSPTSPLCPLFTHRIQTIRRPSSMRGELGKKCYIRRWERQSENDDDSSCTRLCFQAFDPQQMCWSWSSSSFSTVVVVVLTFQNQTKCQIWKRKWTPVHNLSGAGLVSDKHTHNIYIYISIYIYTYIYIHIYTYIYIYIHIYTSVCMSVCVCVCVWIYIIHLEKD